MEGLNETSWDVVIAGTGVQESLLALALSRSAKKILHVDRHRHYGGTEAAFSLHDAQAWVKDINANTDESRYSSPFSHASIVEYNESSQEGLASTNVPKLGHSSSYSLALAPQIIYACSDLLQSLVNSRVESQVEFLAMGSSWVESKSNEDSASNSDRKLLRVPTTREDLFAEPDMEPWLKRAVIKFLRCAGGFDHVTASFLKDWEFESFTRFVELQFHIPASLQAPLLALCVTPTPGDQMPANILLARISSHMKSMGKFGPGFSAVFAKYGAMAEIAQVGCRACAVGGGVYVLGNGVIKVDETTVSSAEKTTDAITDGVPQKLEITLENGDRLKTAWLIASEDNLPRENQTTHWPYIDTPRRVERSIVVVADPFNALFTSSIAGAQREGAVIYFPAQTGGENRQYNIAPVQVIVHSSATGDCPAGQCVLYAMVCSGAEDGFKALDRAIGKILDSGNGPPAQILWKLQYKQAARIIGSDIHKTPFLLLNTSKPGIDDDETDSDEADSEESDGDQAGNDETQSSEAKSDEANVNEGNGQQAVKTKAKARAHAVGHFQQCEEPNVQHRIIRFPPPSMDLVFNDRLLQQVKDTWQVIMGDEVDANEFMRFPLRDGAEEDDREE